MKVFDENGNFIGEFIEAEKEKIEESFEGGLWWLGIIFLFISPFWTILVIGLWLIFKLILKLVKLIFKIVWWIVRLPFCLIFYKELPQFHKYE
ncbi:MAG: hypothetical protein MR598_04690 [Erysipelotrichaceae bacterium]|nr:hypothetical protein [Erysipelotrichaceae bacterium]